MKRQKFFGLPLLFWVVLGSVGALSGLSQEPSPAPDNGSLTLEAAIRIAQTDNPEIRVLASDIAAARGEVTTAKTWQNPEVFVAPGFSKERINSSAEFHGDFGLEQTFEWPGKRALRRSLAEKNVALRQIELAGFRSQLAIQVRRTYSTLWVTREVVALREQRLAFTKMFAATAKKKFADGFAPEFEATKADVEVMSAQKQLREAQAQNDAALASLNALMGRKPSLAIRVMGTVDSTIPLPGQFTLFEQAMARNPGVKAQESMAERSGVALQSIRKSRLPDFKAGPTLEFSRDEQIAGFGITIPLPFWVRKRGEIATATAEQEKARAELEKLRHEIFRDVTTASQNLLAAKESLAFYTPALKDKLKASLTTAAQSYSEGRTSLLVYLELQRTYFDTESDYFATLQKMLEARAELESALGFSFDELSQSPDKTK